MCKEMCIAAESSEQELRRQLREAAAELSDVDTVIEELQEELRQFQVRRSAIAGREAALRQRADSLALGCPVKGITLSADADIPATPADGPAPSAGSPAPSQTSTSASSPAPSQTSSSPEPMTFSLDDDAAAETASDGSMDDWEQGLDILINAGKPDRAAKLKAHWLMAAARDVRDPKQAARR